MVTGLFISAGRGWGRGVMTMLKLVGMVAKLHEKPLYWTLLKYRLYGKMHKVQKGYYVF